VRELSASVLVRRLGRVEYLTAFAAMQAYTDRRDAATLDELWLLEHPPVFTLGLNGRPEHLLAPGAIPVIRVDRGGQVTYHGPGQVVVYVLLDLRRAQLGVRQLVTLLEQSVVDLLAFYGIPGYARPEAPGVYVEQAKIAALGLRVRRGCSYHGLSLNVAMDLEPFSRINPCGYPGLQVTQLSELGIATDLPAVQELLLRSLLRRLGYTALRSANALPLLSTQESGHACTDVTGGAASTS
jgi:lipoyl(octanoyl) transferase